MNLDFVVTPSKDGHYSVACPNFPGCLSEGSTLEEALDQLADKVASMMAGNIKQSLKAHLKEASKMISMNGPINTPVMMAKLPISLN